MLPFVCPKVVSFVFCGVVVLGRENNARTLGGFTDFSAYSIFFGSQNSAKEKKRHFICAVTLFSYMIA